MGDLESLTCRIATVLGVGELTLFLDGRFGADGGGDFPLQHNGCF